MTSPIISSPHLCKETGSSSSSRAATGPQPRIATEAELSAAELLFLREMAAFLMQSDHSFDRQRGASLRKLIAAYQVLAKATGQ